MIGVLFIPYWHNANSLKGWQHPLFPAPGSALGGYFRPIALLGQVINIAPTSTDRHRPSRMTVRDIAGRRFIRMMNTGSAKQARRQGVTPRLLCFVREQAGPAIDRQPSAVLGGRTPAGTNAARPAPHVSPTTSRSGRRDTHSPRSEWHPGFTGMRGRPRTFSAGMDSAGRA